MLTFIARRLGFAIPTLFGVMLLTWVLFFGVVDKEELARKNLSSRNPPKAQITQWLDDHGYNKTPAEQLKRSTVDMLKFDFGKSDSNNELVWERIKKGAFPSFAVASTVFFSTLIFSILFAIMAAYFRGSYIDGLTTFVCVVLLSIVYIVYVVGLQFLLCRVLKLGPVWGFDLEGNFFKFIAVPTIIGVVAAIASEIRLYRTFLLDEINLDYVRTARAKGVSESAVLLKHVLKNAMIPIITNTVASLPALMLGSLILESTFGIPGLGGYTIDAIGNNDFAVIRAMVFLGSLLYILGLILTDICYALVDPRVRLG
jgi:peptide/nickel transport system permease protein